jgi:hypothetical protein
LQDADENCERCRRVDMRAARALGRTELMPSDRKVRAHDRSAQTCAHPYESQ